MSHYLILKALHLISMVAWFAALFYIFRLFVYHRMKHAESEICALLDAMEGRLLRYITLPASLATLVFGFSLLYLNPALWERPWLWAKLGLVALLYGYQALAWRTWKRFSRGDFFLSERACRFWNELPTLVLIGAIFLAILKPW